MDKCQSFGAFQFGNEFKDIYIYIYIYIHNTYNVNIVRLILKEKIFEFKGCKHKHYTQKNLIKSLALNKKDCSAAC